MYVSRACNITPPLMRPHTPCPPWLRLNTHTDTCTRVRAHAHTHVHACPRAHTHARTHARTPGRSKRPSTLDYLFLVDNPGLPGLLDDFLESGAQPVQDFADKVGTICVWIHRTTIRMYMSKSADLHARAWMMALWQGTISVQNAAGISTGLGLGHAPIGSPK